MPYLFVGAGQAGSGIVDDIFEHTNMSKIATPVIFNSTIRDLQNLSNVEADRWYGIAEQYGLVEGTTEGFEEQVTGGFGRDPVRADEVMDEHADELQSALREQVGSAEVDADEDEVPGSGDVPFAFLFFGLGGGTGCGIAPHIAEAISSFTDGTTRIIAVCVLPNTEGPVGGDEEEASPSRQAWNARYGLDRIEDVVDGVVLVDNQRLSYHNAAEGQFTEYNEYIADAVVDLISGPILERIDRSDYDVDPPIIDLQDIVTSLSFGVGEDDREPGYAALGRSVAMTRSLRGYLLPFVGRKSVDALALANLADSKQTVAGADSRDARKAIGLLRAPSRYIRETDYRIGTSKLRTFLTTRCDEVNLGATLTRRNLVSFTALFTYHRDDIDRIAEIERLAAEYEDESEAVVA
ncbi:cell division protein FtsZ [Halosimplex rubrum]|uniref:Cell division protein FtsZ n=1 Tax=Halosimplex rubrum TaxID=869889 RepID=A0A7D5P8V0_9EURY|nr:cell division protein FtsZ [Halosimplex rubrum]